MSTDKVRLIHKKPIPFFDMSVYLKTKKIAPKEFPCGKNVRAPALNSLRPAKNAEFFLS